MTGKLAIAQAPPDFDGFIVNATVDRIYANGTVDVSFGPGQVATSCLVLSTYQPAAGDVVQVMRRDASSWLVLGTLRASNPSTVDVGNAWGFPYNITPATPAVANPYTVSVSATRSFRDAEGWSGSSLSAGADTVAQGAFTTAYGYYRGCYFYGDTAFSALAGRRCTRLRIKLIRLGSGGSAGATQQILAPHAHGSIPGEAPYFVSGAYNVGSLAWSANGTFDCPIDWGQRLIDGTAKGIGHLLLAAGNGNYSLNAGKTADSTTGQILIDWV